MLIQVTRVYFPNFTTICFENRYTVLTKEGAPVFIVWHFRLVLIERRRAAHFDIVTEAHNNRRQTEAFEFLLLPPIIAGATKRLPFSTNRNEPTLMRRATECRVVYICRQMKLIIVTQTDKPFSIDRRARDEFVFSPASQPI